MASGISTLCSQICPAVEWRGAAVAFGPTAGAKCAALLQRQACRHRWVTPPQLGRMCPIPFPPIRSLLACSRSCLLPPKPRNPTTKLTFHLPLRPHTPKTRRTGRHPRPHPRLPRRLRHHRGRARPQAERRREAARGAGARLPQEPLRAALRRGHLGARLAHGWARWWGWVGLVG